MEQELWFRSILYEELKDAAIEDCFASNQLIHSLDDFIHLNVTQSNYMHLIEVCDFLMVENVDVLVDKIVEKFGVSIIHNFSDFYSLQSKRSRNVRNVFGY